MGLRVSDRARVSGSRGAHAGSVLLRRPAEEVGARASGEASWATRGVVGRAEGVGERSRVGLFWAEGWVWVEWVLGSLVILSPFYFYF